MIRKFDLGASPDDWSVLSDRLLEKGYSLEELTLAGLTVRKKGDNGRERYFDMFRSRAMFPIIDAHGNVLAFGGPLMAIGAAAAALNAALGGENGLYSPLTEMMDVEG